MDQKYSVKKNTASVLSMFRISLILTAQHNNYAYHVYAAVAVRDLEVLSSIGRVPRSPASRTHLDKGLGYPWVWASRGGPVDMER